MKFKNYGKCLFVPGSAVSNAVILEFDIVRFTWKKKSFLLQTKVSFFIFHSTEIG